MTTLSENVLVYLSATALWTTADGEQITAAQMEKSHLGCTLGFIYKVQNKDEIYCGLSYCEWQQVFRYENARRGLISYCHWTEKDLNKVYSKLHDAKKEADRLSCLVSSLQRQIADNQIVVEALTATAKQIQFTLDNKQKEFAKGSNCCC